MNSLLTEDKLKHIVVSAIIAVALSLLLLVGSWTDNPCYWSR